jgi:NADP-dependent 3-hydroxy acid dehydrogenase YdfG
MSKKVAIVTGCSSGLGFATVVKLVNAGYTVYAVMRTLDSEKKLRDECSDSESLRVSQLDLNSCSDIEAFANQVIDGEGRVDVLINNAGQALIGPVDSTKPEEVEALFRVNVYAPIRLTQLVLPAMRHQNSGHIIFVGSISGIESAAYQGIYCATKFALEAVALSLATTLVRWNIKVTVLEPGAMNTGLQSKLRIGSYYPPDKDPYGFFSCNILHFIRKILDGGTEPSAVADLILRILRHPHPDFRYPTCEYSKQLLEKHLCDPAGNAWIRQHIEDMKQFY